MADPFLDYALPPLALKDPDEAFRNMAQQLYSGQRVQRAMEARKFRQREAELHGSPLQASPLREGFAPISQATDQQAERAGAPSVSRRQQSAAQTTDRTRTPYPVNETGRKARTEPAVDMNADPWGTAWDYFTNRPATDENIMKMMGHVGEGMAQLPVMAAQGAGYLVENAPDALRASQTTPRAFSEGHLYRDTPRRQADVVGPPAPVDEVPPEMAAPMPAPGALPPRRDTATPATMAEGVPIEPGAAGQPSPQNTSMPQLPPRLPNAAVGGSQARGGTPAVARPPSGAIPLPPRRRPDPAVATDGEQQAFRPPEETEQETGGRREAMNDFFGALMQMGAQMAEAGSQPGATFGGSLARGIGAGGQAFDRAQRTRQEDQRRARLDQEAKADRDRRYELQVAQFREAGLQRAEANRLARARLQLDQAQAARDPVVSYQTVGGELVGFTRSRQQIKTGIRPERSADDLNKLIETAKALSVRSQPNIAGTGVDEVYDPSLMAQSLRLLGAPELAARFEQGRTAQPLQDGQVVSVPQGPDRDYNGQVLQGGRSYRYNAATGRLEPY